MTDAEAIIPKTRALCPRCLKPPLTCYCTEVRPFRTRHRIVLLQHPRERRKTVSTARMAHLCIENSMLIPGFEFDGNAEVNQLIADPLNHCVVLYPGEGSLNISQLEARQDHQWYPSGKTLVIFVIDGSWSCAGKMLRRSRNLSRLPRISFAADRESEYRIRRQPDKYCLSTLEAVYRILELLEPAPEQGILLELFRTMVKRQIQFSALHRIRRVESRSGR